MTGGNYVLAADKFFSELFTALTSKVAIIIYLALLLILIAVLAICVVLGEHQRVEQSRQSKRMKEEAEHDAVIESVSKKLDKNFERIGGDLNYVKRNIAAASVYPAAVRTSAQHAISSGSPSPTEVANGKPDEEVNTDGSRFYMLTEIDREYESYVRPDYDDKIELKELCEDFRNFSAGSLKLYYDIEDIRRFIGGLAVTKLIILQGMSGTGKTSLAYAFGEYLDNKTVVVPIQPMWKERTDLLGYYNEFTRRFNETTLLYKMYEANNNEEIYITVLDEMNIARVEYYFAEFLSLLEIPNPDGRNLDVVADRWDDDPKLLQSNGKMKLPTNMWFIGTANNDDSTFSISDKVYDRA
ncbi:MAG: AAA family ATPase, partial [Clostridia bacterium]|nr:AAA family ATPase [Clostridia bacterium]